MSDVDPAGSGKNGWMTLYWLRLELLFVVKDGKMFTSIGDTWEKSKREQDVWNEKSYIRDNIDQQKEEWGERGEYLRHSK